MLSSPGDINVKKLAFTPYCGVGVVGEGEDGWQVRVGQWLQTHFTLTMCVGTCVRLITMEMSIDVK